MQTRTKDGIIDFIIALIILVGLLFVITDSQEGDPINTHPVQEETN